MRNKYRITLIDCIDRKASTQTFPESVRGRKHAEEAWQEVIHSPFVLCAVFHGPLGDLKRWNIQKLGEWTR